jgi:RecB family exonuclease
MPVDLVLTGDVRAEVNGLLGPRLLQTGPLTGRDALRGDARDTWLWMEALAACQEELVVTYTTPDGEESGRSEVVDELLRSLEGAQAEHLLPSYASWTAASLHDVVQQWSVEELGSGARITAEPTAGHAGALGALLRRDRAARLDSVAERVAHERRLRGSTGHATPLGEVDRAMLREHFFEQVQTTSRLDTLGSCAFRHFASALLRLEVEDVPTLGADAREEGSAAHAALCRVYADLKENGGLQAARRDPRAKARARRVFEQYAAEILAEVSVHPALRAATLQDAWQKTETQLDHDLAADSALEPVALEYSFSNRPNADAGLLEVRDPRTGRVVRVRGQIDRIDRGAGELLTLDYKRTAKKRVEGRHFQLPLYGLVGLRDFGHGCQRVGAAWVELRSAIRVVAPELDADPAAFERALHDTLWPRIDRVVGGDVSPDPDAPETCKRCDFGRLCRFDVYRAAASEDG